MKKIDTLMNVDGDSTRERCLCALLIRYQGEDEDVEETEVTNLPGVCEWYLEDGFLIGDDSKWYFYDATGTLVTSREKRELGECVEISALGDFYIFDRSKDLNFMHGGNFTPDVDVLCIDANGRQVPFSNFRIGMPNDDLFPPSEDDEDYGHPFAGSMGWKSRKKQGEITAQGIATYNAQARTGTSTMKEGEKMNDYKKEAEFLNLVIKLLNKFRLTDRGGNIGYKEAYKSNGAFTEFISALVDEISVKMGLEHYREYYSIDHVLYKDEDMVRDLPNKTSHVKGTWLKHMRVALEHENSLGLGGGYQEFSKLMLFNADIKVLMGWANVGDGNYDLYAEDYWSLYDSTRKETDPKPILFIGEYADSDAGRVDAYLITKDGLLKWDKDKDTWTRHP